jgi:tricorn protease
MIGELNASHSGVSAPQSASVVAAVRIGIRFDAELYAGKGQMKVRSVVPNGPADVTGLVSTGSFIYSVDDTVITASTSLDKLLLNKAGKRVALKVSADPTGKDSRTVYVSPIDMNGEKALLYKEWVSKQRAYVDKASGGRLGYVHIFDMSQESLNQLHISLDAENHAREGVVVDVRNNTGGFVNAYALDVLARRGYMTMTPRGLPSAPARTQLGQRSLEAPTVLVINQHSLSDAEDFTEGYKTLGLGKVVGEPTSGWIIYTSNIPLLDGTMIRVPSIRITDHEGKTMELAPRQPDVFVTRALGEAAAGKDSQLDAAVKQLIGQLDANKGVKSGQTGKN